MRTARAILLSLLVPICARAVDGVRGEVIPAPLTNVAHVRQQAAALRTGLAVQLRGVVTYCDPEWECLLLQDETGGIAVRLQTEQMPVAAGQCIEVEGVTALNRSNLYVSRPTIRVVGPGSLPESPRVSIPELQSGLHPAERVEVSGVVTSVSTLQGRPLIHLHAGTNHLDVILRDAARGRLENLRDAQVRVCGVSGFFRRPHQPSRRPYFFVNGIDDLVVERHATRHLFDLPVTSVSGLPGSNSESRVKLMGTLVSAATNRSVILRDETGQISVRLDELPAARAGDTAEVVGFPTAQRRGGRYLDHASMRVVARSGSSRRAAVTNRLDWPPAPYLPLLQDIAAIRQLPPDDARLRFPVRLRGTVTFWDADYNYLFIQQAASGIFIQPARSNLEMRAGQTVEVTGFTVAGRFTPTVYDAVVAPEAQGQLPMTVACSHAELMTGKEEGRLVTIEGIVRRVSVVERHLWLNIAMPGGFVKAMVPPGSRFDDAEKLIDAEVRARGVCAADPNEERQIVGIRLFVQEVAWIDVLRPAPCADPFETPAVSVASLPRPGIDGPPAHRFRTKGVVTFQRRPQAFFIKDSTGPLWVDLVRPENVQPGDEVEVAGFPVLEGPAVALRSSVFRKTGTAPVPAPVRVSGPQFASGRFHGDYVMLETQLLEPVREGRWPTLFLKAGDVLLEAPVGKTNDLAALKKLKPGSTLRLTGICSNLGDEPNMPRALRILVSSANDIVIASTPPWWTSPHAAKIAGGLLAFAGAAFAWVALLRRQVRKQTAVIRELNTGLERRVAERTAELEIANRDLESFSYSVSHDLRAPLRAVNGFAEILLKTHAAQLDEKGSRYLQNVAEGGRLMGRLVDDLLAFSRLGRQAPVMTSVDLNELVAHIVEDLRRQEPQRQVAVNLQPLPPAAGDRGLLQQALVNLLDNAWKFTGRRDGARIEVGCLTNGHGPVYYVRDNGAGFEMKYADRLFGVFQRLHRDTEFPGTGVGLAIVQRIIQRHGGRIWAESKPGEGATFYFTLPAESLTNGACSDPGK